MLVCEYHNIINEYSIVYKSKNDMRINTIHYMIYELIIYLIMFIYFKLT